MAHCPDVRHGLTGLALSGQVRIRELDNGHVRVARPRGHEIRAQIEIDPESTCWTDRRSGEAGRGFLSACRHLGLDLEVTLRAVSGVAA